MKKNMKMEELHNTIVVCGETLPLAANLRVAYMVQGCNAHKTYTKVFSELGDMPIEKQIEILIVAAQVADPTLKQRITNQAFLDYCLDNYDMAAILNRIQYVTRGVLGITDDDLDSGEDEQGVDEGN